MPLEASYEVAAPDVISEVLEGEVLIVNLASGAYFRGDAPTAAAWEAIASGMSPARAIAGDPAAITAFVAALLDEGLIRERPPVGGMTGAAMAAEVPSVAVTSPLALEKFEDLQDMLALDPIHDVDPAVGWPQPR